MTPLYGAFMKRSAIYLSIRRSVFKSITGIPAIASLLWISGCGLPLCHDDDMVCVYQVYNTEDCLANCQIDAQGTCPESCYCANAGDDCVEFRTMETQNLCTVHICSDDEWLWKTECPRGFKDGTCLPLCSTDELKGTCIDNPNNACSYQICKYDMELQALNWSDNITCPHGFDVRSKTCASECSQGDAKGSCLESPESDCTFQQCEFSSELNTWHWSDSISCAHGFDPESKSCKALCGLGAVQCAEIDTDPRACTLQLCEISANGARWANSKTCHFGFDPVKRDCVDPCDICEHSDDADVCSGTLYDKKTNSIYVCDDSGWRQDKSCFNDFSIDPVSPALIRDAASVVLPQELMNDFDSLVYGHCGECNQDTSPIYCDKDYTVVHICENGQYVRKHFDKHEDDYCKGFKLCSDEYNDILVDLRADRNHCGSCNNKCSSMQSCVDSECVSTIQCNDGETTQIQLGGRWINAYCVGSLDSFKKIGSPNNELDAFVLIDNIDIDEPWQPMSIYKELILLGNKQIITIHQGFAAPAGVGDDDPKAYGLFQDLTNSYVDDLNLIYHGGKIEKADYFGLLAGTATDTTIKSVSAKTQDDIVIGESIAAGGLVGLAKNDMDIADLRIDVSLEANNITEESAVGGVIGIAENILELKGVSTSSERSTRIKGKRNVGGLIGLAKSHDNLSSSLDNSGTSTFRVDVIGAQNVGGLIGMIQGTDNSYFSIENYSINDVNLIIADDESSGSNDCVLEKAERYFGGLVGRYSSNHITDYYTLYMSSLRIDKVTISTNASGDDYCMIEKYLGGVGGMLTNTSISKLSIADVSIFDMRGSNVGGIVGEAENLSLYSGDVDVHIALNEGEDNELIGGVVGNGRHVSADEYSINTSINVDGWFVGGFAGYATDLTIDDTEFKNDELRAMYAVGGVVGSGSGITVQNSNILQHSSEGVNAAMYGGGIVGFLDRSASNNTFIINNVRIESDLYCDDVCGGIVAQAEGANTVIGDLYAVTYYSHSQSMHCGCNAPVNSFESLGYFKDGLLTVSDSGIDGVVTETCGMDEYAFVVTSGIYSSFTNITSNFEIQNVYLEDDSCGLADYYDLLLDRYKDEEQFALDLTNRSNADFYQSSFIVTSPHNNVCARMSVYEDHIEAGDVAVKYSADNVECCDETHSSCRLKDSEACPQSAPKESLFMHTCTLKDIASCKNGKEHFRIPAVLDMVAKLTCDSSSQAICDAEMDENTPVRVIPLCIDDTAPDCSSGEPVCAQGRPLCYRVQSVPYCE